MENGDRHMTPLLSRRRFVRIFFGSFAPTRREPITWIDHDTFLVKTGCLSCCGGRRPDGAWDLDFTVWSITRFVPGTETVERMSPTEALRTKLAAAGIPTEFGGDEIYKSLIGRVSTGTTPEDLLCRMRKICRESVTDLGCFVSEIRQCPRR